MCFLKMKNGNMVIKITLGIRVWKYNYLINKFLKSLNVFFDEIGNIVFKFDRF